MAGTESINEQIFKRLIDFEVKSLNSDTTTLFCIYLSVFTPCIGTMFLM